jgi:starvation-inducible DNA-binding protein
MRTNTEATPLTQDEPATNMTVDIVTALNGVLADSLPSTSTRITFILHVSGPHFRDYHLLLDEQATEIIGVTDAIGERVRKIGDTRPRSIGDVVRRQTTSTSRKKNSFASGES